MNGRSDQFGALARPVAALHFAVAGAALAGLAVWIAVAYDPAAAMDWVMALSIERTSSLATLRHGDLLWVLGPTATRVAAIGALVLAAVQFAAAVTVYRGRRWQGALLAGSLGVLGIVVFPLAFVGVTLTYLSRPTFRTPTSD